MKSRPVIGITTAMSVTKNQVELSKDYIDAVIVAGGIPVLLPACVQCCIKDSYLGFLDGLLLSGGQDVSPDYYGEKPCGTNMKGVAPERDAFEIEIFREAQMRKMPVLGICRGLQIMALAQGGSMFQDIDTLMNRTIRIEHNLRLYPSYPCHKVTIDRNSLLYRILGSAFPQTNSTHHQAVRMLPPQFKTAAWADDGVIEAIESVSGGFALGVQWHPERLIGQNSEWKALFLALTEAASKYTKRKN